MTEKIFKEFFTSNFKLYKRIYLAAFFLAMGDFFIHCIHSLIYQDSIELITVWTFFLALMFLYIFIRFPKFKSIDSYGYTISGLLCINFLISTGFDPRVTEFTWIIVCNVGIAFFFLSFKNYIYSVMAIVACALAPTIYHSFHGIELTSVFGSIRNMELILFQQLGAIYFGHLLISSRNNTIDNMMMGLIRDLGHQEDKNDGKRSFNLSLEEIDDISTKVTSLLDNEKIFLDPSLRLSNISGMIDVPVYKISIAINESLKHNFNKLLSRYRVE
jgi:hypothetical protein